MVRHRRQIASLYICVWPPPPNSLSPKNAITVYRQNIIAVVRVTTEKIPPKNTAITIVTEGALGKLNKQLEEDCTDRAKKNIQYFPCTNDNLSPAHRWLFRNLKVPENALL
ncbi:unnamed protein product [Ectocarpus sp. 12 AP-2014]